MYSIKQDDYTFVYMTLDHYKMAKGDPSLYHLTSLAHVAHHKMNGFVKVRDTNIEAINLALSDKEVSPSDQTLNHDELEQKIIDALGSSINFISAPAFRVQLRKVLSDYHIEPVEPSEVKVPKPKKCPECAGWGCHECCSSEAEIRAKQGIFG